MGDSQEFWLAQLRAGGATLAANAGLIDFLLSRHGRLNSDKDGYIKEDVDDLSVSKVMYL